MIIKRNKTTGKERKKEKPQMKKSLIQSFTSQETAETKREREKKKPAWGRRTGGETEG